MDTLNANQYMMRGRGGGGAGHLKYLQSLLEKITFFLNSIEPLLNSGFAQKSGKVTP